MTKFDPYPVEDRGRDWAKVKDLHYEGRIKRNNWVTVIGEASCTCLWSLDINIRKGKVTFRQCFDIYGAYFTLGRHTEEHRLQCLEALPAGLLETVDVFFDTEMTLRDLIDAV